MLMRSVVSVLMAFNIAVPMANAESITGIQIVEYGIYTARLMPQTQTSRSEGGVPRLDVDSLCHVATTLVVPARLGLHFGFRYNVQGSLPGQLIDLTMTARFPAAMRPPGAPNPLTVDKLALTARVGVTKYTGFKFGSDWHLVPGTWRFELSYADRKLAELAFEVVDGAKAAIPPADESTCFPVS
jgi:hypothetical protein